MFITTGGVRLFYEKYGEGPPLLLLHGSGQDHTVFDALGTRLCRHFTLYAIDSRNHGESDKTGVYDYQTMMKDTHGLIQALGLFRVSLAGFSDGAIISLLLAIQHPELVEKMALLGVNLSPGDFTADFHHRLQDAYQRKGRPWTKLMLDQPNIPLQQAATVTVPTLVVGAEHDIIRPETFTSLAGAMPQATLKIMGGHQHDTYITGQDLLYPDLLSFFTGTPAQ